MAVSTYRASVPAIEQMMTSLSTCLDYMAAFCEERGIDPANILAMRLAPDMFTLTEQVQRATQHAQRIVAGLAGLPDPVLDDSKTSFADLKQRIDDTLAFVRGFTPEQLEGGEDRVVSFEIRVGPVQFKGADCLFHYSLPQMYFHVTTAYDIMRHAGVQLRKMDYLGTGMQKRIG